MRGSQFRPQGFWAQSALSVSWTATLLLASSTLVNNCQYKNNTKKLKNDCNPGIWVLIWEYSLKKFQWIPTWQGIGGFEKSLCLCVLGESSFSIRRVKLAFDFVFLLLRRLLSQWDPHRYPVIGLHNRLVLTYEEILDQIEDLLFIIISKSSLFLRSNSYSSTLQNVLTHMDLLH